MTPWARNLQDYVPRNVRERGLAYYAAKAVRDGSGDAWHTRARVRGGADYQVELTRERGVISSWCTCPYVERGDICKHIWAVVLEADARGWLRGSGEPPALELDASRLDDIDDIDRDEFDVVPARAGRPLSAMRTATRLSPVTVPPGQRLSLVSQRMQSYRAQQQARAQPEPPAWQKLLDQIPNPQSETAVISPLSGERQLLYVIDVGLSAGARGLTLEVNWRDRKKNGEWTVPKTSTFVSAEILSAAADEDEPILDVLGDLATGPFGSFIPGASSMRTQIIVAGTVAEWVLPRACATGRCMRRTPDRQLVPLEWDDGPPWTPCLEVRRTENGRQVSLDASFRRGDVRIPRTDVLAAASRHLVTASHIARVESRGTLPWLNLFARHGPLPVPIGDVPALLARMLTRPGAWQLEIDPELGVTTHTDITARRTVRLDQRYPGGRERLFAHANFDYDGLRVDASDPSERLFDPNGRRIIARDRTHEEQSIQELADAGFRRARDIYTDAPGWELAPRQLPDAVRRLTASGWSVEAEGRLFRRSTGTTARVRSGIDWFDLEGEVHFGEATASIRDVLGSLSRGETMVTLDDGSVGILPEDWLAGQGRWAGLAHPHDEALRFTRGQIGLLDALLEAAPAVDVDAQFERARHELRSFDGIAPADPPPAFVGRLREYQRDGLGWIRFLERFGFGGCLAETHIVGKTVQVLAALADRRTADPTRPPSLVIVPRSIVFNWLREAARFCPTLRVADWTGAARARDAGALADVDLLVTTYGTLRRDVQALSAIEFDYVVLDEAHAIKNVDSQTAKAVRLLNGRHRLALTGTPVQNHIGELWSLFEFLNPGMLGRQGAFSRAVSGDRQAASGLGTIARALRPFILRRTKERVACDLPPRVEDTIVCRLGTEERAFYDGLRQKYRRSLTAQIAKQGWARSHLQVLEALLRLRQAACHPGLVDERRREAGSTKLDVLLSHLREVLEEGHKAIVFSQFVTLLGLVRPILDREGVVYEYLDGSTVDRAARVDRFQNDPECRLFLISLKAGGLGLNLTAAEYVFLLDPWWNPAIEAQAIDRAHRIGQTQQVFAYRLIAEHTIEEKVLALQAQKRALADSILTEDESGLRALTREDLELLLS